METVTAIVSRRTQALTLVAACLALFVIFLDNTIVNVAIPTIQRDLGSSPDQLEWTVNAYVVTFAGLVLLAGKIGDRLGRRRMFVAGLILFGAASAAGALATSAPLLIGARALQGGGAALIAPLSLSLLATVFRREDLPAAVGVWTGVSGLGLAIGPLLGGLLVENSGWHAVFWVNVPIAMVAATLTLLAVPESRDSQIGRIDIQGALLVTTGLVLLVAGLARAVLHPWADVWTLVPLVAGAVLLAGFAVQQMHSRDPLIPVAWLRTPDVLVAVTTLVLASFALFGAVFLISLYLQDVRGYTAVQAGIRMLPLTLTTMIIAPLAGKVVARRGPYGTLLGGLALTGIATISLTQITVSSGYGLFALRQSALGVGLALALPTVVSMVLGHVDTGRAGVASGLVTMSRQFGGALGLALLATIGSNVAASSFQRHTGITSLRALVAGGQIYAVRQLAGGRAATAAAGAFIDGFTAAMWLATVAVAAALGISLAVFWTRRSTAPTEEGRVRSSRATHPQGAAALNLREGMNQSGSIQKSGARPMASGRYEP
jgi:EmrB/QacA subfamily drug resistance transporter